VKGRQPKIVEGALGVSLLWASLGWFFVTGGGLAGRASPVPFLLVSLITCLVWGWVVWTVRQQNAAGKTLAQLQGLPPDGFEEWVAARFRDRGYQVTLTGTRGDHGVDLIGKRAGETVVIQCKNYKVWSVGEPVLRDLFGAMHDFGADRAHLVTTGQLTRAARAWVNGKPIDVWDGAYLARLSQQPTTESLTKADELAPRQPADVDPTRRSDAAAPCCPKCGSLLVEKRNRRTGEAFLACPGYPACRHTQPLSS